MCEKNHCATLGSVSVYSEPSQCFLGNEAEMMAKEVALCRQEFEERGMLTEAEETKVSGTNQILSSMNPLPKEKVLVKPGKYKDAIRKKLRKRLFSDVLFQKGEAKKKNPILADF